ncbi:aminotransferase class I/II-fold pyridoxal phosphate-dependent enzyme [bacterium]|nr:aminotransferase class I/II-fold pyridoxal phosphate-dependent enzyme [bacterium]
MSVTNRPRRQQKGSTATNRHGLSAMGLRSGEPPISWLMDQALSHPKIISLAAGFTDNASLPISETRTILKNLLANSATARSALQYGNTMGDTVLRQATIKRLRAADKEAPGPRFNSAHADAIYDPIRLLITHGSQQFLYMLMEALCDPGDIVLVEDPTYFVFLGMAQSHGLHCRGIRMTKDGIDVEHLGSVLGELQRSGSLPRVKLLYLVSYNQNPTGITTTLERKAAALNSLRRFERKAGHTIYLLEDAAYRDLRFAGSDVASALTVAGAERRVIYTSTYSKPFATGIRVGYGLLPPQLAKIVTRIKGNHDFGTAHLLQCILAEALNSGRFDRHLKKLRKRYAAKADAMGCALDRHCAGLLDWGQPQGGLYFWARIHGRGRSGAKSRLFQSALANDVLYVPGALCYADDSTRPKPDNELRLSFGSATEDDISEGIARLARAIRAGNH